MHVRIWIMGGLLIAAALTTCAIRPASELSVNTSCELDGPIAKLKAATQGRAFWEMQRRYLEGEIAWEEDAPRRQAERKEDLDRILADADESIEEIYKRSPSLRPSAAESAADELRAQADALERAELNAWLERGRLERIERFKQCLPIIEARLSS